MRIQLIVTVSFLLLLAVADAGFAKQLTEFNLRTELKKLTKLPAAASRTFHPQGSISDYTPASTDLVCLEAGFRALVSSTLTACGTFSGRFPSTVNFSLPPTEEAHRAAWNTFCDSPCATAIHAAVASKYWVCLQPALQFNAAQTDYFCSNKDSHGDVCGLVYSRIAFAGLCEYAFAPDLCRTVGSETCRWSESEDGCEINATQLVFDAMCGSCITGLTKNVYSKYPSQPDAAFMLDFGLGLCSRAPSGAYCWPLLAAAPPDSLLLKSNSALAALCHDDDRMACLSGSMATYAARTIDSAQGAFVSCARSYGNVSTSLTTQCLPSFLETVAQAQAVSAFVGAMCTTFAGTYCIPVYMSLTKDGCPADPSGLVARVGCCLGTAQSIWNLLQTTSKDTSLLPRIPGYTPPPIQQTLPPAPSTQHPVVLAPGEELSPNPGAGGLFRLAACGVTGLNESLRVRCAQNRFEFSKNLLLKLNYAAVTATPAMKEAFMMALRRDVARNAKVSPSQITDDSISATDRVQVTTASGHGMQVQGTASGVQYNYTIEASNEALAEAASVNVDAAVNVGYLDMTSTRTTVEERCAACVGLGGAAGVSQASSTTVGNTIVEVQTPSGAAAMGTLLAVVLTALALFSF